MRKHVLSGLKHDMFDCQTFKCLAEKMSSSHEIKLLGHDNMCAHILKIDVKYYCHGV